MVKYLIMDVDGTLTDGKIYMGEAGEMMKVFSVRDGYGIYHILKNAGIEPVIITGRTSRIVQTRCDELGITKIYQGKQDKLPTLIEIAGECGLDKCAYIGDDTLDLQCMKPIKEAGGIVGCPSDAVKEVIDMADFVSTRKGGDGAVREFIEWLAIIGIIGTRYNSHIFHENR